MPNVLYEVSFKLHFSVFIPILLLVFLSIYPKLWLNLRRHMVIESPENEVSAQNDYKRIKKFIRIAMCFVFVIIIIIVTSQISQYKQIIVAYKNGDYQVVEGYVENFEHHAVTGESGEAFEINGIKFHYEKPSIEQGYCDTKGHGGVIDGDGQHLKIGYVTYDDKNVIVYIEQLY